MHLNIRLFRRLKNTRVVENITDENTSLKEQLVKWQTKYHGKKLCIYFLFHFRILFDKI